MRGSCSTLEGAQGILTALYRMKMFKGTNDGQTKAMFDRVLNVLKKQGPGALITFAKETAFAVAADLVLADGVVEDEEKKFLDDLQKALELKEDLAVKIAEVMAIKKRG